MNISSGPVPRIFPKSFAVIGGKEIVIREPTQLEEVRFLDAANATSQVATAVVGSRKPTDGIGTVRDKIIQDMIVSFDGKGCEAALDSQKVWQEALTSQGRALIRDLFDNMMSVDDEEVDGAAAFLVV